MRWDEDAVKLLAEEGYDPKFGARPLRRLIQRTVEDSMSEGLLTGTIRFGETVKLTVKDGKIVVVGEEPEKKEEPEKEEEPKTEEPVKEEEQVKEEPAEEEPAPVKKTAAKKPAAKKPAVKKTAEAKAEKEPKTVKVPVTRKKKTEEKISEE